MHRSRNFKSVVLLALFMFAMSFVAVPCAVADDYTDLADLIADDGEPTDPQRIHDVLEQFGADLESLGLTLLSSLDAWIAALRSLVNIAPEEPGQ